MSPRLTLKHRATLVAAVSLSSAYLSATEFQVVPLDLGSGFTLSGTISTDGTTGSLSASNINAWNINVRSVQDFVFNRSNTVNLSSSVHSDGTNLSIPTSPNGFSDGGALWFRGGNYLAVQVANFTGASAAGGQAYYVHGSAFDILPLNQPNNFNYVAATARPGIPNQFDINPLDFGNGVTMFGTLTTDGSVGATYITDWNVVVRSTTEWNFNTGNSSVLSDFNLGSDGTNLFVTPDDGFGGYGLFAVGNRVGYDLNGVLLADYSYIPDGQAGLVTPLVMQTVSPLSLDSNGNHIVASVVPEPMSLLAVGVGLCALLRRRPAKTS